ncbi:phosphatase PAP2 family protein [Aquirufa ecclesiirivi]|uniref:Phosphatase PAP2 family protein n=1 Tax=Aquirufa ecclesiirivi TaxID=2715124 RepID=A0ABT4JJ12_9BACT|nr:phosphatase PAP2 family protein [Aquirufa ecclesiirivi]MCZ2471731.1 phosphatase PAP2 family protein [Aquirufa ecclesiirivi]MCZ2476252.1 phosphatase PAP2 family protein [Aquirufa ecclesiirivi]MDF0693444.1 phosphatase PAP2 family protein [Aquirufa ecclesiirivi]
MASFKYLLLVGLFFFGREHASFGQEKKSSKLKPWIAPLSLTLGGLAFYNQSAHDKQLSWYHENYHTFHSSADDFLQYSPTLIQIGARLLGAKAQHKGKEQLGLFLVGTGIYVISTQGLKRIINETRPNGSEHSFPSGHTATAFFGATVLAKELGKEYPWLAITGYTLAAGTGYLRLANNEHWLSDVLVGAGIGIASAEIAYCIYPKLKERFAKSQAFQWEPRIAPNYYAASFSYHF